MNKAWNAGAYRAQCGFVPTYGKDLFSLLPGSRGKRVVDIGCGCGNLSHELEKRGFAVTAVDGSPDMAKAAHEAFPSLDVRCMDVLDMTFERMFDIAFSNAVFHWIDRTDQIRMLGNVRRALVPGGCLVAEMGGKGCAATVHAALSASFEKRGMTYVHPHFFPSAAEYAVLLEKAGLEPVFLSLFDRPTTMKGPDGLRNWIRMFVVQPFSGVDAETAEAIVRETEDALRPLLFDGNDWTIDYVRLRLKAENR